MVGSNGRCGMVVIEGEGREGGAGVAQRRARYVPLWQRPQFIAVLFVCLTACLSSVDGLLSAIPALPALLPTAAIVLVFVLSHPTPRCTRLYRPVRCLEPE